MNTTTISQPLSRPWPRGLLRYAKNAVAKVVGRTTPPALTQNEPAIPEFDDAAPAVPQVLRPQVSVGANSLNQGLGEALQQAVKDFMRKHVQPINALDASIYFRLDAVCVHETEAARPHLKSFFQMAERLRIRYFMGLVRNTLGTSTMLDATRLASMSCVPTQGPAEGYAGTVLMVFERAELPLTIEFIGDFEERESAVESTTALACPPVQDAPPAPTPLAQRAVDNCSAGNVEPTTILYAQPSPRGYESADFESTPLAPSLASGPEPVLILTLRLTGREDRRYPVYERDLPLVIGRHIGQTDAMLPTECYVSRKHLVLVQFHAGKNLLIFEDCSTNGSWDRGGRKASRFGYVLGQDGWLSLGGKLGEQKAVQLSLAVA